MIAIWWPERSSYVLAPYRQILQSQLPLSKIASAKIKNSLQIVQNHTQTLCWYQLSAIRVCSGPLGMWVSWWGWGKGPNWWRRRRVSALPDDAWGCWTRLAPVPGVAARVTVTARSPALLLLLFPASWVTRVKWQWSLSGYRATLVGVNVAQMLELRLEVSSLAQQGAPVSLTLVPAQSCFPPRL